MGRVSIHRDHPFLPPEEERSPVRRLRGRVGSGVSAWTTGVGPDRAGLAVSSMMVADGEPGRVLGLVDPVSDLFEALVDNRVFVVNLLGWADRGLADAFAGVAPAPGGRFRLGSWTDSPWGPVLDSALAWAGCRMTDGDPRRVGWSLLVEATVDHVVLPVEQAEPMVHRRGRYHRLQI
jgi:flavin reductase (DIM6/NTAB) family NADH-FMN oxidoreductase RutF